MNTPAQLITTNNRLLDTPFLTSIIGGPFSIGSTDNNELIRNISNIITERLNSMNNEGEKSIDLSEIVLREQNKEKLDKSPSIDESKPMFAALKPVELRSPIPDYQLNITLTDIDPNSSENSTLDDSQDSNIRTNNNKRSLSPSENKIPPPTKRGRKPLNTNMNKNNTNNPQQNKKLTKKERLLQEAKNPVCFGNKVVEKGTEEYDKRRHNNNLAVKLCRQKQAENQKKREETMKTLEDENKRLTQKVQKLTQELACLKDVIHSMNPKKLPSNISELINRVELN